MRRIVISTYSSYLNEKNGSKVISDYDEAYSNLSAFKASKMWQFDCIVNALTVSRLINSSINEGDVLNIQTAV